MTPNKIKYHDPMFNKLIRTKNGFIGFIISTTWSQNEIIKATIEVCKSQYGQVYRTTKTITYNK